MTKNIVILGGGFGGLHAAKILSKKLGRFGLSDEYKITLVDKNDYHTYTPTLYEAATTSKETANYCELQSIVTFPIKTALKNTGVAFLKDEVVKIEPGKGAVLLKNQTIGYDYLILALGSENNFYNILGAEKNSFTLKSFMDALRLRDAIINAVAEHKNAQIIIGGGGSTGVELSGEIKKWMPKTRISIIEASDSILKEFAPKVIREAEKRLSRLGIKIMANKRITSVDEKKINLADGKMVSYNIFVWGGGTKTPKIITELPLKIEDGGRKRVESSEKMVCLPRTPDLSMRGKIYAIGDIACTKAPAVANAAIDHAKIAAENIIADILNRTHKIYEPHDYPYIIPIGGKYAIVKIGPIVISGFFGWIIKGLVEIKYLLSILPFSYALRVWLKGLRIFIQNDRLG